MSKLIQFPKRKIPKQNKILIMGIIAITVLLLLYVSHGKIKNTLENSLSNAASFTPNAQTLTIGSAHVCWIDETQKTWCWGQNETGQLGERNLKSFAHANQVDKNLPYRFTQLYAYDDHNCAINTQHELYCWGGWSYLEKEENEEEDTPETLAGLEKHHRSIQPIKMQGLPDQVQQVALGIQHTCTLLKNNEVWCWGDNSIGQQAKAKTIQFIAQPEKIQGLPQDKVWRKLLAGPASSCVISDTSQAWCWGVNLAVQALDGDSVKSLKIEQPHGLTMHINDKRFTTRNDAFNPDDSIDNQPTLLTTTQQPINDVIINLDFACVLTANASIQCWGGNHYQAATGYQGEDFLNQATPLNDPQLFKTQTISTSNRGWGSLQFEDHSCALKNQQQAYCWGLLSYMDSGSISEGMLIDLPKQDSQWIALKSGHEIDCVQSKKRQVYCWGQGLDGSAYNPDQKVPPNFKSNQIYQLTPNGLF
jgi:alpha-tubulin suppressor-like RCC1 family protein